MWTSCGKPFGDLCSLGAIGGFHRQTCGGRHRRRRGWSALQAERCAPGVVLGISSNGYKDEAISAPHPLNLTAHDIESCLLGARTEAEARVNQPEGRCGLPVGAADEHEERKKDQEAKAVHSPSPFESKRILG